MYRYEIMRSFVRGNGLLAIRIHTIAGFDKKTCAAGSNPFDNLAFVVEDDRLRFTEYMTTGWKPARDVGSMPFGDVTYALGGRTNHTLSNLFPIYDWDADGGFRNLGTWIESAAKNAGR